MPRLRTLKPEFFTHESLCELSPLHRLLYEGTWCYADREGRLEDRPRYLKTVILPYDIADVDAMLDDLAARGFIIRYVVDGKRYIFIPAFLRHQKPHPKERPSEIPPPPIGAATNGPRLDTPAQGVAITVAAEMPGKDQTKPRKSTVEPGKDLVEPGGLGGFCLGDLGLGASPKDLRTATTEILSSSVLKQPKAVAVVEHFPSVVPDPEEADRQLQGDENGEFQPTGLGFCGWWNKARVLEGMTKEIFNIAEVAQWAERCIAEVGEEKFWRAADAYLRDKFWRKKGCPLVLFRSDQVWRIRANEATS